MSITWVAIEVIPYNLIFDLCVEIKIYLRLK